MKIPCSIGILTLNSGKYLARCLESTKDFVEIIICDGNSTDNTLEIAKQYGAKIIKQYDSEVPNLPCVKDKANVRQKNMTAATYDWYFFMDSDDVLSSELISEIMDIVSQTEPKHLVYRMPTRIFIDGKEIKYEAAYPSYQARLVNKKVDARFKGHVHERLIFDEKKYSVGTLKNFYNFHWSKERHDNYGRYLKQYALWETEIANFVDFKSFFYWGFIWRLKVIFGYLFYRLPKLYLLHGFKDSMGVKDELLTVLYHFRLLLGFFKKYLFSCFWSIFLLEIVHGKDIYRVLSNKFLQNKEYWGKIIDLGGGQKASHYRYLRLNKWRVVKTANISSNQQPDFVLDFEYDNWDVFGQNYDVAFAFNLLEHLQYPEKFISRVHSILKTGGSLVGVVPFLVNVHPDPHDYQRFTVEKLIALFKENNFSIIDITSIGIGPFTVAYSQIEFVLPRIFKFLFFPLVYFLDYLIRLFKKKINWSERYPLAYFFEVKK
jgi:glycosyltransferase involved in cell wall biosynthesis